MGEMVFKKKKLSYLSIFITTLFALLLLPNLKNPNVRADEAKDKAEGLRIAKKVHDVSSNFDDMVVKVQMILRTKAGDEAKRDLVIKILEQKENGTKSLVIFQNPPDVKGTAFLSFSYKDKDDDQWIYLPAIKRVKRISSNNQNGPFMASEFAYEDMSAQEVEKFDFKFIKKDKLDGANVLIIEKYPKNQYSGYSKETVWVDEARYLPLKVEYVDKKDSLLKTLTIEGYTLYMDKYWRPNKMSMINHQTGKSTELHWNDYKFQNKLKDKDFNQDTLSRVH